MYGPCTESDGQTEVVLLEAYCNNLARCAVCSELCAEIRPLRIGRFRITTRDWESVQARRASEGVMLKPEADVVKKETKGVGVNWE